MLLAFSAVDTDSDEEGEDEDEADPELLKAIEAEVRSRRAIEKSERSAADKGDKWTEVPLRSKGKSVVATSICGIPLTEAYVNPFATLEPSDSSGADLLVHAPTADAPVENLLERMRRRLEAAAATSPASPTPSLSGVSSIRAAATNADTIPKDAN